MYMNIKMTNKTLVHGDFHVENVIFSPDGKIKSVVDFDNVKVKFREAEVIWCLMISFFDSSFNQDLSLAKTFLRTYANEYPIEREDIQKALQLYLFGIIRSVWAEEDYYLHGNQRVKDIIVNDYNKVRFLSSNMASFLKSLTE
jgi:Ser/Thr protein kinase RdoA (MazF antagonist)